MRDLFRALVRFGAPVRGSLVDFAARYDYYDHLDHNGEAMPVTADTWTVAEAKAKFSEVMDRARSKGPQTVTRSGRKSVVVVSADEWERKTKRAGSLAEFFASSPLRGSELRVKRQKHGLRKLDL